MVLPDAHPSALLTPMPDAAQAVSTPMAPVRGSVCGEREGYAVFFRDGLVEQRGIEPLTSSLRTTRSPN